MQLYQLGANVYSVARMVQRKDTATLRCSHTTNKGASRRAQELASRVELLSSQFRTSETLS